MNEDYPLVSFGIVNCNRLYYLKSCYYSLLKSTADYPNIEIIIVDNASTEGGTHEFLDEVDKAENVRVFRQTVRDPSNEFAKGLNLIVRESRGDFIAPLQGDMQFTMNRGWLKSYVDFMKCNKQIGCILFDAQRRVTNINHGTSLYDAGLQGDMRFFVNLSRPPFSGAADVFYSRDWIEFFYPWNESNESHEGGLDSETHMLRKVEYLLHQNNFQLLAAQPQIPVAVAIYTDSRGTNARVRGNKRYGDYWPPLDDFKYYQMYELSDMVRLPSLILEKVASIEDIAIPIGWKAPIDESGSWKKNPIRPETATESDYTILEEALKDFEDDDISEWLKS